MNNPLVVLFIVFGLIMVGLSFSVSISEKARYQCVQDVAKALSVDKAKELCK